MEVAQVSLLLDRNSSSQASWVGRAEVSLPANDQNHLLLEEERGRSIQIQEQGAVELM